MDDQGAPNDLDVTSLAGSLLISLILNWALLGVLCVQVYTYYVSFPKDRLLIKTMVYSIFVSDIVQTIIITRDAYVVFVLGFGNKVTLDDIHTHWFTIPISGGFAGLIGQTFFAYRITIISRGSKVVPYTIGLFAFTSGIAAIASAVQFFMAGSFDTLKSTTLISVGIWNGIGALCDVLIAIAVPYYLLRSGAGFDRTHILITRLIRITVETGILTAFLAIAHLILYFIFTDTFIIAGVTIAKLYANTMLVILNNRIEMSASREALRTATEGSSSGLRETTLSRIQVSRDRMTIRIDDIPLRRNMGAEIPPLPGHGSLDTPNETKGYLSSDRLRKLDEESSSETEDITRIAIVS